MEPDVRAATDAILHHLRTTAVLDTMEEAEVLAQVALQAARPKMWLRYQQRIDELEQALAMKGGSAAGGMCPHCGQML